MPLESIKNFVTVHERLATAGQPSEAELREVRANGFEVVINLGLAGQPYSLPDEAALARELGVEYHHVPVDFRAPRCEEFERVRALLSAARHRKVFLHCAANYRVSCFFALFAEAELGWSRDEADAHVHKVWSPDETWLAFMSEVRATIGPANGGRDA